MTTKDTIEGEQPSERWADWLRGIRRPPRNDDESDNDYTDRCVRERMPGKNRQCSIGWHSECSDPDGETCTCPCHWFSLEDYIAAIIELEDENAKLKDPGPGDEESTQE